MKNRIRTAIFAASAAFVLSGCATDGYGYGGGIGMGYGNGYYGGDPYWGWYDNYYYPGTGYYIYDRGGNRHRWSDNHRRYWEGRRGGRPGRENWNGYSPTNNSPWRAQRSGVTNQNRDVRREAWRAQRQQQAQPRQQVQREQRGESRRQGRWGADRPQSGGQETRGRGWGGGGREGRRGRD